MEEWRDIPAWEDLYEVSSLGRVRSKDRYVTEVTGKQRFKAGRILRANGVPPYGYLKLSLKDKASGRTAHRYVHLLVCAAFNGPKPEPDMQVAHNDGNCLNNAATNLRWATPKENTQQKVEHGTQPRGEAVTTAAFTNEEAEALRILFRRGATAYSLAKATRVARATIERIVQGKRY